MKSFNEEVARLQKAVDNFLKKQHRIIPVPKKYYLVWFRPSGIN